MNLKVDVWTLRMSGIRLRWMEGRSGIEDSWASGEEEREEGGSKRDEEEERRERAEGEFLSRVSKVQASKSRGLLERKYVPREEKGGFGEEMKVRGQRKEGKGS